MKIARSEEMSKINNGLLSAVSHELRAPLSAIKGYSTMLLDYFSELTAAETQEYIKSIDMATDRMTRLIDNLLDASRLEEGRLNLEKTQVNILNLINAAIKEVEIRDSHHEILTALDNELPMVYVDPKRIQQVLEDLIDNAARCSPRGTEILISATSNNQEIEISVTGRDPGIADSEFCNISELLYKMEKTTAQGNNNPRLELYMCQRLVEAHSGRMWAESIVGKGTTIKFTLPLI
ncbi:MAG: hypothetical protein A2Y89_04250 [Chloroflexi bacterium RBG_13_51_18]|nr:MAG: hypothetical protein A2Y89_04250 [Chloroflexi bacterium RBG_13_51_18]